MPDGFARFLKKLQQATTRRTGIKKARKTSARRPARATVRAMFLTGRGVAPGRPGFYNPAVKARKARKAR